MPAACSEAAWLIAAIICVTRFTWATMLPFVCPASPT
jgi:hypothetical protein